MAPSQVMGLEGRRGSRAMESLPEGELKRELRWLAGAIADDDDRDDAAEIEAMDRACTVLSALRDLKSSRSRSGKGVGGSGNAKRRSPPPPLLTPTQQARTASSAAAIDTVPEHFLCPISSEIMKDPVVVATGETYDRPFIQAWLNAGHRTCPRTQQVLSHSILTPNYLVRRMVSEWCESHGVDLPPRDSLRDHDAADGGAVTQGERVQLGCLLDKISSSSSVAEQKQAARELRLLTKRMPSFRALLGETPDALPRLLGLLSYAELHRHPDMQEDVVTTILNISIHDSNKRVVGENPRAIPLLVHALTTGTMETRSNAAAALFTLSALDANKLKIGESGSLRPLVRLLEDGTPVAKKDAASAVFNLCMAHENRSRAVKEGAVRVLLRTVVEQTLVDESLAILAMLASNPEAVEEMAEGGGVPCMLGIIRDSTCGRNRENAAVVLYAVCINDRKKLREVREEEDLHGTVSQLAQNGTSRARRKAAGILERLNRARDVAYYSL